MKAIKLSLLLAFAMLATTASAQFVNSGNNATATQQGAGSTSFDLTSVKTSGWNRIFISYNPSKVKIDIDDADDIDFKGFQVGYLRGFSLTKKVPLYLEAGVAFQYRSNKDEDSYEGETYTTKYKMMSLNIPVNLLYRFNFNDDFSISPYFGLDFRFNLSAKYESEWSYEGDYDYGYYDDEESNKREIDLLDEDDVEKNGWNKKDDTWGRFQAGWHIGVGLDYRFLHVGVEYGTDFSELCKKTKLSTTSITVGLNF